ncbi:MAG: porin family protein [Maribacter sp.]
MKKTVVFIVCAFIGLSTSNAQVIQGTSNVGGGSSADTEFNIGVKAGFGASTFFGSGFTGISARPSVYAGGIAEIPAFFDGFYLQPELVFSLQGADVGLDNLNLYYLNIPLMCKYHITEEIAVELGPQIGFLVADSWDDPVTGSETNKINLGINIGGGYRLNENLYFQLRFSPGFTKILDDINLTNGVFQVGAAYFF